MRLTFKPHLIILILAFLIPFEDFFLKFLPVSDKVYFYSRFISELTIYSVFILVVFHKLINRTAFRKTPIDIPVAMFIGVAIISTIINQAPFYGSFLNMRSLLRYLALFYLIVNMPVSKNEVSRYIRVIIAAGVIQLIVGALQFISGGSLNSFFLPRQTSVEIGGVGKSYILVEYGREIGSIFGASGDTILFSVFLLIVLVLALSKVSIKKLGFNAIIFLLCIFGEIILTYSRVSLYAAIIVTFLAVRLQLGWGKTVYGIGLIAVTLSILLLIFPENPGHVNQRKTYQGVTANILSVYSSEYVEVAKKQRLGILLGNIPTVLMNKPILGYGPDVETAVEELNASEKSFLYRTWTTSLIKDVYWVAILTFYGLGGLLLFIFVFFRLFSSARMIYRQTSTPIVKQMALIVILLVVVTSLMLFFNQVLEFRPYGFYFWLFCGLMFASYTQEQNEISKKAGCL